MTSMRRLVPAALVALALASPATAQESGNFVYRLGRDTTSVEHYTRTGSRIVVDQVGRAPRVLRRQFTYELKGGVTERFGLVATAPGATAPAQTWSVVVGPDSLRLEVVSGNTPAQKSSLLVPPGTVLAPISSPWVSHEGVIQKLVASKKDTVGVDVYLIGLPSSTRFRFERLGRDSIAVTSGNGDVFHVRIDKTGHVLGVLPVAGTAKFSVDRVAKLDLDATTARFAAQEKAGAGLGTLSPRDTVRSVMGSDSLWIDYGRPAARGRTVFGQVVPYGEVWRTGANAATQFRTSRALDLGGATIAPGFYTLWTIPTESGWKLIVNKETGQWGTAYKAENDLARIQMEVTKLAEPVERFTILIDRNATGGYIHLDWENTRASVPFTLQ